MAADASISGLASGLDTATIISQLMQLEAAPQTRLKTRLTAEQSQLKSLQSLNSQLAALATKAGDLASSTTWQSFKVTSSVTGVTGTAGTGAAAGTTSVHVDALAVAHRLTYASTAALSSTVVTNGTDVKLTVGATTTTLATDGTLAGLVSALNKTGTGVHASTVKLDDGTYRLSVEAASTGAAAAFTLTDSTGAALLGGASVVAGSDAAVTIGSDTVHAATNTFTGVVPGLDFTISAEAVGTTAVLTVATDPAATTAKVKGVVDAVNAVLAEIDRLTDYDAATKTSGPLASEGSLRTVRSALVSALYPPDGSSMADVGLQTDRTGKLVFDATKFATALAADPAGTAARFTGLTDSGFGSRVKTVATAASDPYTGTLTASITGRTSGISTLQDSIDAWTDRLDLRRTTLTRQFTAMETALSKLQSQSNWLAGQISSLSSGSGSQ